jgi:hypothetical protein
MGAPILARAERLPACRLPFATYPYRSRRGSRGLAHVQTGPLAAPYSASMVQRREISMKILVNVSAFFLSMILALIPFAVIAVNDLVV